MIIKRCCRSWIFWSLGLVLLGCARYYPLAENAIRRYPSQVEILPPPPEEAPIVELLPPPPDAITEPVNAGQHNQRSAGEIPMTADIEQSSPLNESNLEPIEWDVLPIDSERGKAPLSLRVQSPRRVQEGGGATFQIQIVNQGDRAVADTRIECRFDGEIEFPGNKSQHLQRTLNTIKRNDTRDLLLTLAGKEPGWGLCRFTLYGRDVEPIEQQYQIQIIPRLWGLSWIGPDVRSAGQSAEWLLKIVNRSSSKFTNMRVHLLTSSVLAVQQQSDIEDDRDGGYVWKPDDLPAGQTLILPLNLLCTSPSQQACLTAVVNADDVPQERTDACMLIAPVDDTLSIELNDRTDPAGVGQVIVYEACIENRSLTALKNIEVKIESTDQVVFESMEAQWEPGYLRIAKPGWRLSPRYMQSEGIAELPPNGRLKLLFSSRGNKSGDARVSIRVTCEGMDDIWESTEYTIVNPREG